MGHTGICILDIDISVLYIVIIDGCQPRGVKSQLGIDSWIAF